MSSNKQKPSSYDAFNSVDSLVSKPALGSDNASSWQQFRKNPPKTSTAATGGIMGSAGTAPHAPLKKLDRLGTGFRTWEEERSNEARVRRESGDAEVGSGYTTFKKRGPTREEVLERKRIKNVENRIRPDDARYFIKSETFDGWKEDYVFTTRDRGTGYYWDGMDSWKKLKDGGSLQSATEVDGEKKKKREKEEEVGNKKKKKKKKKGVDDPVQSSSSSSSSSPPDENTTIRNPMEQIAMAIRRRDEILRRGPNATAMNRGTAPSSLAGTVGMQPTSTPSSSSEVDKWEVATDPSTNKVYYFNRGTGERRWEKPTSVAVAKKEREEKEKTLRTPTSSTTSTTTTSDDVSSLPEGWMSNKDQATGRMYYYHSKSGKTSWERPTTTSTTPTGV